MLQRIPGHGPDSGGSPQWWQRLLATIPIRVQMAVVVTVVAAGGAAAIAAILFGPKPTACPCGVLNPW